LFKTKRHLYEILIIWLSKRKKANGGFGGLGSAEGKVKRKNENLAQ